jgi:cytidylate kinase
MTGVPVVTIDGPSGAGKGTVAQQLARTLRWNFLDSGALYRLLGLAAKRRGVPLEAQAQVAALARELDPEFVLGSPGESVRVRWLGEDVSAQLRGEDCARLASILAAQLAVRQALLDPQRALRRPPGLIADGRDMGTVVFPDARLKIYLTASTEERARRRYRQLKALGLDANLKTISQDLAARDASDSTRDVAPLKPAADAVVVDTTQMDVPAVCRRVLQLLEQRFTSPG